MIVSRRRTLPFRRVKELFVYECHGSRPPAGEPGEEGFLGMWSERPFYYLFFEREPGEGFFLWLAKQGGWTLRDLYRMDYDQWQQTGAEWFEVGPFLIGTASECAGTPDGDGGIVIRIDPGLVFGSGLHGSTRGCLLAIARLLERETIHRVVDLGTGTGILGISCAVLGVDRVLGIDNNILAIRTAARNIRLNGVDKRVQLLVAASLSVLKSPSDLLVLNLEPPIMKEVLKESQWQDYRWVILSGLLGSQWSEIEACIPPAFRLHHRVAVDEWVTVTIAKDKLPSDG